MPGEDTNGQSAEGSAPASAPALTEADIQAMIDAKVEAATEVRVRGLQSSYEKQLAGVRNELSEAKSDPDRYEADNSTRLEAELAAARQETEALRVARQYPEVFPTYEAILSAKGPVEQLDVLQAFVKGNTPAPAQGQENPPAAPAPAPSAPPLAPPPVDPNRPAQEQGGTSFGAQPGQMDQALADRIIDGIGDIWPKF
jgi:hypothetical protein